VPCLQQSDTAFAVGEAFVVYSDRVGLGGRDPKGNDGAYQLPIPDNSGDPRPEKHTPNVWRIWESPTLQLNDDIQKVTGVEKSQNYLQSTE